MSHLTVAQHTSLLSPSAALAAIRMKKLDIPKLTPRISETFSTTPRDANNYFHENRKLSMIAQETWKVTFKEAKKGILIKRKEKNLSLSIFSNEKISEMSSQPESCPSYKFEISDEGTEEKNECYGTCKQKKTKKVSFASDVKSGDIPKSPLTSKRSKKNRVVRSKKSLVVETREKDFLSLPGDVCMAIRAECEDDLLFIEPEASPEKKNLKIKLENYGSFNDEELRSIKSVGQEYGFKLPLIGTTRGNQEASIFREPNSIDKKSMRFLSFSGIKGLVQSKNKSLSLFRGQREHAPVEAF